MRLRIEVTVNNGDYPTRGSTAKELSIHIPDDNQFKTLLPLETLVSATRPLIETAISEYERKMAKEAKAEEESEKEPA